MKPGWDDRLIDILHKRVGVCGHCGKKKCQWKISHSRLPSKIDTDTIMDAIAEVGGESCLDTVAGEEE